VAVIANDREGINPLTMGKFLKIEIPRVLEITKQHNYIYGKTFKMNS
jgi:hypothetical protein